MNVKLSKHIHTTIKRILNGWYFCMKPLASLIKKYDETKSAKRKKELENMSLDEVARLYVKYTVKAMVRRNNSTEEYFCCTKKDGYPDYYDSNFILADLTSFGYSRFTKTKLRNWSFYSVDYKSIGYGDGSKDRWIELENKLRDLVEKEFLCVGCKVEYVDQSDKLDDWFIEQSGYEKTMIVSV